MTIAKEQAAFEQQVPELLKKHRGEFVLMHNGKVVGFFDTHSAAYADGLRRFGVDATFLVAQVIEPRTEPVSFAWEAGVLFG